MRAAGGGDGGGDASGTGALEQLLLERARGFVVSLRDGVTGGVHCSLGGGPRDFLVTSTLASQAPPALGRALATSDRKSVCRERVSY